MGAVVFNVTRDGRRSRTITSESAGSSFTLQDTSALPFGNRTSWRLKFNDTTAVSAKQGSFSSSVLLMGGQGSHLTTIHKSFSGTDVAFAWRSKLYSWTIGHSGVGTSRIQMRLLEDCSEQEVARIEGVAAGTLSNPGRNHEIDSIIMLGGKRCLQEPSWVQVVIMSGMVAAKQQRKQITAYNSRPCSPRAISPRYV